MKYFIVLSLVSFVLNAEVGQSTPALKEDTAKSKQQDVKVVPSKENPFKELKSPMLTGKVKVKSTHLNSNKESKKKKVKKKKHQ